MRKISLLILMAASAVPALAAVDDDHSDRGASTERSGQVSEDRDSHRPSEDSRFDRSSMPQRAERTERAERARASREERVQAMTSSGGSEAASEGPQVIAVDRRGEDGRRGFGMRRRGEQAGQQVDGAAQQPAQQDARRWNGWQPRERRIRSVPDTNITQQVGTTGPERPASSVQRRHRDGDRNRWSQHWRNDGRYDWRRHRDRHRSIFRIGFYYDPFGWGYRRFGTGSYLWPSYYGSRYWINDPWQYRLPPAYGPYRWVRYHNDALLIDTWTGEVVDVIYGFFW